MASAERNYPQIEREALAIIYGVKKFHKYLYGRRFTLITDNEPLTSIFAPHKGVPALTALRLQRWSLLLSAYQYDIVYRSSKENANADVLSRFPIKDDAELELSINLFSMVDELPITAKEIAEETRKDAMLSKVYLYVMNGWPVSVSDPEMLEYVKRKDQISAKRGCLLWGLRVIIPRVYRGILVKELHNDHLGTVRMKGVARSYFWYPGIDRDIELEANSCEACQTFRADPPPAPLRPWRTPMCPWERIHIDFGYINGVNILVVIDSSTKWLEAFLMNITTAEKTIEMLRSLFARHGLPKEVVSDNGPQFTSSEFVDFLKKNHVKQTLVPAYHPASNGAAEKSVQTIKNVLKKYLFEEYGGQKTSMQQKLDNFLLTYRTTPHSTTQCTPASLFYKRDIRTRFTLLRPDLQSEIAEKQTKQILSHDNKQTRYAEFSHDEIVRIRNYISGQQKWSVAKVLRRLGEYRYLVQIGTRKRQVHVEQMLKVGIKKDIPPHTTAVEPSSSTAPSVSTTLTQEKKMPVKETESDSTKEMPLPEVMPTTETLQMDTSKSEPDALRRSNRVRKAPERLIEKI